MWTVIVLLLTYFLRRWYGGEVLAMKVQWYMRYSRVTLFEYFAVKECVLQVFHWKHVPSSLA